MWLHTLHAGGGSLSVAVGVETSFEAALAVVETELWLHMPAEPQCNIRRWIKLRRLKPRAASKLDPTPGCDVAAEGAYAATTLS